MSQGDLGAIGHIEGLSFGEGSQTSLTKKRGNVQHLHDAILRSVHGKGIFIFII